MLRWGKGQRAAMGVPRVGREAAVGTRTMPMPFLNGEWWLRYG